MKKNCFKLICYENLDYLFSIFNLNLTIVIMNTPKHLLNAMEVMTCRNGMENTSVLISDSSQIF